LASLIASFAFVTPAAAEDAAAATDVAATASTDVAQANPFSDVPANSWAYDAVRQLAAAGLITGYPDNTFKGNRPMTRYEMAVLVNRAVNALQSKMAQGAGVSPADLAAVRRLVDAFGPELQAVRQQLAALRTQTDANTSAINALRAQDQTIARQLQNDEAGLRAAQTQLAANRIGLKLASRPSGFTSNVTAIQPFTTLPVPATVAAGTSGSPQVFTTGNGGGPLWQNLARLDPQGSFDGGRFQWFTRLETVWRAEALNGTFASTPAYCTGTSLVNVINNYSCQVSDISGNGPGTTLANIPMRLAQAWMGYFSPGGFFAKIGRMGLDEGRMPGLSVAAQSFNGGQFGFRDSRVYTYVAFSAEGTRSSNRAFINGQYATNLLPTAASITGNGATFGGSQICPLGNPGGFTPATAAGSATNQVPGSIATAPGVLAASGSPANSCILYGSTGIIGEAEYYFPGSRTAIGATYDGHNGTPYNGFNPYAGLCVAGANGTTVAASTLAAAPSAGTSGSVWNTLITPPAGGTSYCPSGTVPLVQTPGGTPVLGAYQTVQTQLNYGSVYLVQYLGPYDKPLFRISAEYGVRLGNDPFSAARGPVGTSAQGWKDNKVGYFDVSYSSGGNVVSAGGPLFPSTGVRNANVVQLFYMNAGLNSYGFDSGIFSGSVIPGQASGFNGLGLDVGLAQVDHWFSPNFRAGVYYLFGTNRGVSLPASAANCPACVMNLRVNVIGVDTFLTY
jgi:hypothetical protein